MPEVHPMPRPMPPLRARCAVLLLSAAGLCSLSGCAVVAATVTAASATATAVKVTATVVETTVDVAAAGVKAVTKDDVPADAAK